MKVNSDDLVAQLIQRHGAQVRRIIERRSGPAVLERTTVDDLYQETVAAALTSAPAFQYRDDARFIGWITTIARRTISKHMDHGRPVVGRIKRDDSTGVGVFASHLPGREGAPSSAISAEEAAMRLREAIKALPEDYRQVVILYRIEERPLSEVATTMGRSKVATCRLLARAFSKLRKTLAT
jgi:RNA polymerase sigma-70 factor (ECF subfamily)